MVLDVEVYPKIPRKQRKAVPEGNGPVLQHNEFRSDQPTLADIYRPFEERHDRQLAESMKSHFDEHMEKIRETRQRLAGFEHNARQPRLAMEADVKPDTKTRKRPEHAAADRVMIGDSSSAQVDSDPMCLTSFVDDSTEPPVLPCCRDDAMVVKDPVVLKPCLSPVEMRTLTATNDLLLIGTSSTATRIIFHQLPLWFCPTKEMNSRTSIQYSTTAVSGRS